MKTDRERLSAEVAELENARTDLEAKNETIRSEIDGVQQQHGDLTGQIAAVKETIARENTDSANLRERLDSLNRDLESGKSKLMEMVAEEARTKNTIRMRPTTAKTSSAGCSAPTKRSCWPKKP